MAVLRVLAPNWLQGEYHIDQQVVTVGRSPENTIWLNESMVSRLHLSLIKEGDEYIIVDNASKHGTFVNGIRVDRQPLAYGSRIQLGEHVEILFTDQPDESKKQVDEQISITPDQASRPSSDIKKKISLEEAGFDYQEGLSRTISDTQIQEKYLSAIYHVNQTITETFDSEELAHRVLDLIFQIFPLDRAVVVLYDQETDDLFPLAHKTKRETGTPGSIHASQTILRKVIQDKSAVLAQDTYLDDRFKNVSSIMRKNIRSVMCVPLHTKGKILGALYTDSLGASGTFSDDDLRLLLAVAGALANSIENARLVDKIKEDERRLSTLERYLPSAVVKHMLYEQSTIRLGGKRASISVLFADVRGFTSLTEQTAPNDVVRQLNDYFSSMSEVVFDHGGTLGEYIGDEIMVYFGAPLERDDHATRAIAVALKMMEAMESLKKHWEQSEAPTFDIGIGIATGEVIAGNVGSAKQMKYTIIGNAVNLASRLCAHAKPGQILISPETYESAEKPEIAIFLENTHLRGMSEPVDLYEIRPPAY